MCRSRLKPLPQKPLLQKPLLLALALELLGSAIAGCRLDKLPLRVGQVFLAGRAFQGILSGAARLIRSLFVELVGTQRRIGENRDQVRLHL